MTIVNLSVHKNNKLQRERKQLRKQAVEDMKGCVQNSDIAGYCIVSWNKGKDANVAWDIREDSMRPKDLPKFIKDITKLRVLKNRLKD